jgi:TPR repeat protein
MNPVIQKNRIGKGLLLGVLAIVVLYVANLLREPHPLKTPPYTLPENWLRRAQLKSGAENSALGQFKLGKLYENGLLNGGRNVEKALQAYERSIEMGNDIAKVSFSSLSESNDSITALRALSDEGSMLALLHLIDHLSKYPGTNDAELERILRVIKSTKGVPALRAMAESYLYGRYNSNSAWEERNMWPERPEFGEQVLRQLIEEARDPEAAFTLGNHLAYDNDSEGIPLLEFAASMNHGDAMRSLSSNFAVGTPAVGYKKDADKSLYWLEQGAINGNVECQKDFGEALLLGDKVPQDIDRGYSLLRAAVVNYYEGADSEYFSKNRDTDPFDFAPMFLAQACVESEDRFGELNRWISLLTQMEKNGSNSAQIAMQQYRSDGRFMGISVLGKTSPPSNSIVKPTLNTPRPETGWLANEGISGGGGTLTVHNTAGKDAIVKLVGYGQRVGLLFIRAGEMTSLDDIPDGSYRLIYALGSRFNKELNFFDDNEVECLELDQRVDFKTTSGREYRQGQLYEVTSFTKQKLTLQSLFGNTDSTKISQQEFKRF